MDRESGRTLYNKNMDQQMYPASITKIVTAIVAIEQANLDDIVTVTKEATEVIGTRVYLLENEQVSLLKLIQGLLINSGNDAGTAIAIHLAGSEEEFAKEMNRFVKDIIGTHETNFTNPHGLFDENHVTTAYDMAKITRYAMENPLFREIVGTKELEWIGEGWETTLYNHHRLLLSNEYVTGVKNGYVDQSGHTLVTTAKRDGMELIVVTLKAPSASFAYHDTEALMELGFNDYETGFVYEGERFKTEGGQEFELLEDIRFVKAKEETISLLVNNSGLLRINNERNERIHTEILDLVPKAIETTAASIEVPPLAEEVEGSNNQSFFLTDWFSQLFDHFK
ncbi:D-alanyl-D-alanine carboxypeptidase [Bacillus sp. YZJH907-2]|uniref:D-alanyl-D-alanine carboxypeptidase n=2 Tax=Halalkalibacter suaedae TaxID=2822140 RepID=A0A940WPN5_9BACI|nr:D-alanyl-D-alanine carboxypeptidase [Bacillus suaedae]